MIMKFMPCLNKKHKDSLSWVNRLIVSLTLPGQSIFYCWISLALLGWRYEGRDRLLYGRSEGKGSQLSWKTRTVWHLKILYLARYFQHNQPDTVSNVEIQSIRVSKLPKQTVSILLSWGRSNCLKKVRRPKLSYRLYLVQQFDSNRIAHIPA